MAMKADYIGVDCFVSENNLSKNSEYFRRFFYYYKKNVYVLPFVFEDRFINYQSFGDRRNKVFVSGSLTLWDKHEHSLQDFFEFYETNNYHPGRELVLINKDKLINEMDVFVRCIDLRSNRKIRLDAHQNYYKSFNIVQKLNSYRMFMSPEEIHDLPSIGFVEGMACGSAYIGKSDPMYDDIGLKDGVHFIAYDGSLSDLKEKIHYFQLHEEELERIAITGYRFVHEHFNGEVVAKKFVDDIVNIKRSCNADCYSSFTDISV